MKKLLTTAALAATLTATAHADTILQGLSYACTQERYLDTLAKARQIGDYDSIDILLARRDCYLINNAALVDIAFEKDDKVFFRGRGAGANRVKLWTWSRNIRRDQ